MKRIFLLLAAVVVAAPAFSASVWKVSKGESTIFVGGTLHLLSEGDYPLPTPYEIAFDKASSIVLETDLDAVNSPAFSQQLLQQLSYSDGSTIQSHLSEDTYNALASHFASRGWPIESVSLLKPQLVSLTLTIGELQRLGLTLEGVDSHYAQKAKGAGKTLAWLESPEQQLAFIVAMGEDDPDGLIQYTLEDIKTLPENLSLMKDYWFKGDLKGMTTDILDVFAKDYPEVYKSILVERNHNWLPHLISFFDSPEVEFVLVGALHLPGNGGVLALLEAQGYTVEKVKG
ncbi:TraB/GumN family protein [Alteromonas sp. KUL49]|uniref:TraB/GumN family protein n=1 Tax=Alteromonas sp. KUL49 TaxID=2480798 RepID=UPI00102EE391|nr:TraB/GumN family protein [Alteromonas sp. KUL49]TAP35504.1 TraB/GumN family protein [Alteromonas sp. KUL49]